MVIAAPWSVLPAALAKAGDLASKIVVDTTNQFGSGPMPAAEQTAAAFNAARMPGSWRASDRPPDPAYAALRMTRIASL